MQKITPHLWYDKEAVEAAECYVNAFGNGSKIKNVTTLNNTPSGTVDIVIFELMGFEFQAISAGPLFKFNATISFSVAFNTNEAVEDLWKKLIDGGRVLMELGEYPFSERYGWLQDKYGVTWQLISIKENEIKQPVFPLIMFVGDMCGKAEEAINFYTDVIRNSSVDEIHRYGPGREPDKENAIEHAFFTLEDQRFAAMDSALPHQFKFNEAISFIINCKGQEEIDYYWEKLSSDPKAEQCGWLKDKYGLSWQIVPSEMNSMLHTKDQKKLDSVTKSFLKMKKFDVEELKRVFESA